jgi:predicted transcriptional regulator
MEITEKEFAVIREISGDHNPDQRTIALRTGISLGLTNLIIKRLINKGFIKARQLDKKKIQYILTSKGFSEKAQKSYCYALRTIELFKNTKEVIQELIHKEHSRGAYHFTIDGNDELSDIAELALKNMSIKGITYSRKEEGISDPAAIHVHASRGDSTCRTIDLLEYISNRMIHSVNTSYI